MGKLEGYTCDNCGKHGTPLPISLYPHGWYVVQFAFGNWNSYVFCSKQCVTAWVLGESSVGVPESKSVLLRKLLKAIFA